MSRWFEDDGEAFVRFCIASGRHRPLAPITARSYRDQLRWLSNLYGLDATTGADLQSRVSALVAERTLEGAGVSARAKDAKALRWLAAFYNVPLQVHIPTDRRIMRKCLSDAQVDALARYEARDPEATARRRALLHLASVTGLRPSEMAGLRRGDIMDTPSGATIHVGRPAKGGMVRDLMVPKSLVSPQRAFGSWIKRRPIHPLHQDTLWTTTSTSGAKGHYRRTGKVRVLGTNALRLEIARVSKALGFQLNCTILRHTVATRMVNDLGWPLNHVQWWLGHASIKSTAIYAEVSQGSVRRLVEHSHGMDPVGGK